MEDHYLMPGFRWVSGKEGSFLRGDASKEKNLKYPEHAPRISFRLYEAQELSKNYSTACMTHTEYMDGRGDASGTARLYSCPLRPGSMSDWNQDPNYVYMKDWIGNRDNESKTGGTKASGESTKDWIELFRRLRTFNMSFGLKLSDPVIYWNVTTFYTADIGCGKVTATQLLYHNNVKDPDPDDPYERHGTEEIIDGGIIGILWAIILLGV